MPLDRLTEGNDRAQSLRLAAGLFVLSAALRWSSLDMPLDVDEGVYASVAMAWHKGWGWPYLDFFDHKPPLLYAIYAAAFGIGGWKVDALRLFSLLWQATSAAVMGMLLWQWTRSKAAAWAGGLAWTALGAAWGSQAALANAEGWGWLPILLGLLYLRPLDESRPAWRWILWGLFAGMAACIKQPYYVLALGVPCFWERSGVKGSFRALAASLLGLSAAHAPWMLWLAWHGALKAWWWAVFVFHLHYGSFLSAAALKGFFRLVRYLAREEGLLWVLCLGAFWPGPLRPEQSRLRRLGALFLGLGLVASALSGRWYPHYAVLWTLGLSLLATAAFLVPFNAGGRSWRWVLAGAAGLAFLGAQRPFWNELSEAYSAAPRLAAWIQANTGEEDRLLLWSGDAELYFLAQRRPAGRSLNNYGFIGITPAWPGAEAELFQAVTDPRTRVVVISDRLNPADALQKKLGDELLKRYQFRRDIAPPFWVGLRRP